MEAERIAAALRYQQGLDAARSSSNPTDILGGQISDESSVNRLLAALQHQEQWMTPAQQPAMTQQQQDQMSHTNSFGTGGEEFFINREDNRAFDAANYPDPDRQRRLTAGIPQSVRLPFYIGRGGESDQDSKEIEKYGRVRSMHERSLDPYIDGSDPGRAFKDAIYSLGIGIGATGLAHGAKGLRELIAKGPRVSPGQVNMAFSGIKRFPALFHGTGSAENVDSILKEGFTRGQSAELSIPGVSLSRDPTVSTGGFAKDSASNVLRVTPEGSPADVRNLRPSEFVTGVSDAQIINKPSALLYKEAETFVKRPDHAAPTQARRLTAKEQDQVASESQGVKIALEEIDNAFHPHAQMHRIPKKRRSKPLEAGESLSMLANAVVKLRGNRGAFDDGMQRIVDNIEDKMSGHARVSAPMDGFTSELIKTLQPEKAIGARRAFDRLRRALVSADADIHFGLGAQAIKALLDDPELGLITNYPIGEVKKKLDDAQRLWVTERNALADRITAYQSSTNSGSAAPIRNLEDRTKMIRAIQQGFDLDVYHGTDADDLNADIRGRK